MENNFVRFDKYMRFKKLNDNIVTKDLDISVGLLGKTRNKGKGLSKGLIEKILNFYQDLSVEWLLSGSGSMLNESEIETLFEMRSDTNGNFEVLKGNDDMMMKIIELLENQLQEKERIIQEKERMIEFLLSQNKSEIDTKKGIAS